MSNVLAIKYLPAVPGSISNLLRQLEEVMTRFDIKVLKEDIVSRISTVIPQLRHLETGKNLDEGM